MDWSRDGAAWPNRETSRFVDVRPHRWHVQETGTGPTILLLHGAGGATHSWRHLLPLLAQHHHVVAPDLPGQGFTRLGTRQRGTVALVGEDVTSLCADQGWSPDLIVGHSAGGALALEVAPRLRARGVVGINPAVGTFDGIAGWLFPMMAKLLSLNPFVPLLFSRMAASEKRIGELLASTGSTIDPEGVALYHRLASDRAHVEGTLTMMAQWDVEMLVERLSLLDLPCLFLVGERDGTVPPRIARDAAARMPLATVRSWEERGHLLHEEAAEEVAEAIAGYLATLPNDTASGNPQRQLSNS